MNNSIEQSIPQFKQHIVKGLTSLGIRVSPQQTELMALHAKELMAWNKKINLTAIKNPLDIAEKHFVDSIAAISFFRNEENLLDMGAGGGFPGIPIKIMMPSLRVVMVDASRKKVNFLKHVIRMLHLENIDALHSRVEDLHGDDAYKGTFDAVISRAFTELSNFAALASPFLSHRGTLYAMKGKLGEKEITQDIQNAFDIDAHLYQLPFEHSDRLVIKLSPRR